MDELPTAQENVARLRQYDSIGEAVGWSELVAVGRFESVKEGRGFSWSLTADGEEVRHEHPYGSKDAWVHTIHITFRVGEVVASRATAFGVDAGDVLIVGLALDDTVDMARSAEELSALGEVVVFLVRSPVFDYSSDMWAILEDGAFLGQVTADGTIEFPVMSPGDEIQPEVPIALQDLRNG
jgi:hypothetical protein